MVYHFYNKIIEEKMKPNNNLDIFQKKQKQI